MSPGDERRRKVEQAIAIGDVGVERNVVRGDDLSQCAHRASRPAAPREALAPSGGGERSELRGLIGPPAGPPQGRPLPPRGEANGVSYGGSCDALLVAGIVALVGFRSLPGDAVRTLVIVEHFRVPTPRDERLEQLRGLIVG